MINKRKKHGTIDHFCLDCRNDCKQKYPVEVVYCPNKVEKRTTTKPQ